MTFGDNYIIPTAIALIMVGIGFNITPGAFMRVFTRPKGILTGLASQMIALPLVAFGIASLWPMDPIYKVGLLLVAACPGGTASNLVTHMLKGRIVLSVSLTAFNSFLIIFTIPLIVSLALQHFMGQNREISLSLNDTLIEVLSTVVIPTFIGMGVNHYFPRFTESLRKPLRFILPGLLVLVFTVAVIGNAGEASTSREIMHHLNLLVPSFLLNVVTMLTGYRIGRLAGITHGGSFTIAIEMGLQNSALAIFIATQVLRSDELALMAVIYSSFSFFTTYGLAYLLREHITVMQLFRNLIIRYRGGKRRW